MEGLAARLEQRPPEVPLIVTPEGGVTLGDLTARDALPQSAAICIDEPSRFLRTLLALEGRVETLLLLSSALPVETVSELMTQAGILSLQTDRPELQPVEIAPAHSESDIAKPVDGTRWLMTTSGTTGTPKLIPHTLDTLSRTVQARAAETPPKWGMLYDPTRFAGMQVVLQSLLGGGTLIAPNLNAPLMDQVAFLAEHECTHLSATPTLWRRLLMVPGIRDLPLRQATLGGEIVDQKVLDSLAAAFPDARITHIYASTEAGVGFSVGDRLAGFPALYFDEPPAGVQMKVVDGILWLKADGDRRADSLEMDDAGFICSGDRVQIDGDRVYFLGRDSGLINVGGVKVYPEVIERVILGVDGVRLVQVGSKKNPISGALVTAQIVADAGQDPSELKARILERCRATLEREAVPAIVRFVADMEMNVAGKLVRKT